MSPLLFIIFLLLVTFGTQGCATNQVAQVTEMSVDYVMLDDAVNLTKARIIANTMNMAEPDKSRVMSNVAKIDSIQLQAKAIIALHDFSSVSPIKLASLYAEAKAVTLDLKDVIYDEANGFVNWNQIDVADQIQLQMVYNQADQLGAKIETYLKSPDNSKALQIATDVATYGYLTYKIIDITSK